MGKGKQIRRDGTTLRLYKTLLWKAYFDKGLSITNYFKWVIAFFGLASRDVKITLIIAIGYAISCLILGRIWFHFKLVDTEHEIQNIVNPTLREIKEKVNRLTE